MFNHFVDVTKMVHFPDAGEIAYNNKRIHIHG